MIGSADDKAETRRLLDEIEQLRTALETALEENGRLTDDKDRLQRRLTAQARSLHATDLAHKTAVAGASSRIETLEALHESRGQAEEELRVAVEELQVLTGELEIANASLHRANRELDARVEERTRAIVEAGAARRESEERFRQFAENSSDVLWICDAETRRLEYLSPAFETVYGVAVEQVLDRGDLRNWMDLVVSEDRDRVLAGFERVRSGERVAHEFRVLRPNDGAVRWVQDTGFPIRDAAGAVRRVGGVSQDVTARQETERIVRASRRRLRALIDGIPQLVWRAVDCGQWTWSSPQWTAFTGLSERASTGRGWQAALHPDDRQPAMAAWKAAEESGHLEVEYRLRHAGENRYRWFQTRASPVRDEDTAAVVEWLGTSTDIDDMRRLQDHQSVMVAELQHRTRNLLGVVRSLGDRTIAGSTSLAEFRVEFRRRLAALSRVQGLLSRLEEGDKVAFDELLHAELSAHGGLDDGQQVTLDGPAGVRLRSATVQTFALALHELATNATKYGALAVPDGRLAVSWRVEDGDDGRDRLHVDWRESGVANMPEPGSAPQGGGYGRELIERALPYQLGAETSYEMGPDGVRCRIVLPTAAGRPEPA